MVGRDFTPKVLNIQLLARRFNILIGSKTRTLITVVKFYNLSHLTYSATIALFELKPHVLSF